MRLERTWSSTHYGRALVRTPLTRWFSEFTGAEHSSVGRFEMIISQYAPIKIDRLGTPFLAVGQQSLASRQQTKFARNHRIAIGTSYALD